MASRGGRGGRGRGGSSMQQRIMMGSSDGDPQDDKKFKAEMEEAALPQKAFPPVILIKQHPASVREQRAVKYYLEYRRRMRTGPLHMIAEARARIAKKNEPKTNQFDPFNGNTSYATRFRQPTYKMPKFDPDTIDLRLFPRELWEAIDPKYKLSRRKPRQDENRAEEQAEAQEAENEDEAGEEGNEDEDADEGRKSGDEEEDANLDDDFSDNDSDMGGDYNAEQYFDNGEDDEDEGGGGGGGGDDEGGGDYGNDE